jgi:hypothetical protein
VDVFPLVSIKGQRSEALADEFTPISHGPPS